MISPKPIDIAVLEDIASLKDVVYFGHAFSTGVLLLITLYVCYLFYSAVNKSEFSGVDSLYLSVKTYICGSLIFGFSDYCYNTVIGFHKYYQLAYHKAYIGTPTNADLSTISELIYLSVATINKPDYELIFTLTILSYTYIIFKFIIAGLSIIAGSYFLNKFFDLNIKFIKTPN